MHHTGHLSSIFLDECGPLDGDDDDVDSCLVKHIGTAP